MRTFLMWMSNFVFRVVRCSWEELSSQKEWESQSARYSVFSAGRVLKFDLAISSKAQTSKF